MKVIEIRHKTIPISSEIQNAYIDFSQMTVSVVAIITDIIRQGEQVIGYGFSSIGRYGQEGILKERIIPRLRNANPNDILNWNHSNFDPSKAWEIMMRNEKPGGHGDRSVAVGTIDMALWDIVAKIEKKPLYKLLADWYNNGKANPDVMVYAAGGYYYPNKNIENLKAELRTYLDMGYKEVKIKVGQLPLEEDLKRIEAAIELVGNGSVLAVDANGKFGLEKALGFAKAILPYELKWYEEPGDPLDYKLYAEVAKASTTPIATGENLFSLQETLNMILYGGLYKNRDVLQMDPVLGYGLVEYLRILEMIDEHKWPRQQIIPHGGNLFSLHIVAGLGLGGSESYPGVFQPFGGFGDNTRVENGIVKIPDIPGIGIEQKSDLYRVFLELVKN